MPVNQASWALGNIIWNHKKSVDLSEWELFTELMPGHFYTRNMNEVRTKLHENHICALVHKSGLNKIKNVEI